MFKWMDNIKVAHKMLMPLVAFFLGFAAYGLVSYKTLETVQVKGPLYNNVVQGKDLIADVLPPPEYIIEANLVSYEMVNANNSDELKSLKEKGMQLQKDFETRHEYWDKELPNDNMKTELLETAYTPAKQFFDTWNNDFLPAIERGDKKTANAILNGKMKDYYQAHRSSIDKVVQMATARNVKDESSAMAIIKNRTIFMFCVAGIMVAIALIIGYLASSSIVRRIKVLCNVANRLSEGDLLMNTK